jgi:hypothetical protein
MLEEALRVPGRASALLNAFSDNPAEREQMRGLLRNAYVNRLLGATRDGVPGERTLNAAALEKARAINSAIEREILTPGERGTLDDYVKAAHDNAKILQRIHGGSSETAALRHYEEDGGIAGDVVAHAASSVHPMAGLLLNLLSKGADNSANQNLLQRTLTEALLDPDVYNRIGGAVQPKPSAVAGLLGGLTQYAQPALTRGAMFAVPRGLGPLLSGAR